VSHFTWFLLKIKCSAHITNHRVIVELKKLAFSDIILFYFPVIEFSIVRPRDFFDLKSVFFSGKAVNEK